MIGANLLCIDRRIDNLKTGITSCDLCIHQTIIDVQNLDINFFTVFLFINGLAGIEGYVCTVVIT